LANFNFDFDIYSKLKEYLDRNGDIDLWNTLLQVVVDF
jgi:hypothetical protein